MLQLQGLKILAVLIVILGIVGASYKLYSAYKEEKHYIANIESQLVAYKEKASRDEQTIKSLEEDIKKKDLVISIMIRDAKKAVESARKQKAALNEAKTAVELESKTKEILSCIKSQC